MPDFIMASMMALEQGAQHVWRRTTVSPIGALSDIFPCPAFFIAVVPSDLENKDI